MKPFWTNDKIISLEFLKATHTNGELAEHFNTTKRHIVYSMEYFGIKRTIAEYRFVQTKRDQKNENNGNWKGGKGVNHYHYKKLQRQRYPERIKARARVHNRIKSGKLVKENCKYCDTDQNIQAHISNYGDPFNSIIWCCRSCNRANHYLTGKQGLIKKGES